MIRAISVFAFTLLLCSCSKEYEGHECPPVPVISNAVGHVHGVPCTADTQSDCKYGTCDLNPFTTYLRDTIAAIPGCTLKRNKWND